MTVNQNAGLAQEQAAAINIHRVTPHLVCAGAAASSN